MIRSDTSWTLSCISVSHGLVVTIRYIPKPGYFEYSGAGGATGLLSRQGGPGAAPCVVEGSQDRSESAPGVTISIKCYIWW